MKNQLTLNAGSSRAMLADLGLQLWEAGRFDPAALPEARGKPVETKDRVLAVLMRSSTADVVPALAACLNGDQITVQGRPAQRSIKALKGLGIPVEVALGAGAAAEPRYLDMTPMIVVLAALIMGVRYMALGMHDRMLYVLAGLGYALFFVVRSFSYLWQRPRSQG